MAGITKVKGSGLATGAATDSLVGIADNATSNVVTIASNNRVDFAGGSNAFGIHLKHNAATSGVYLGSPSDQAFQVSSAGGSPYLNINNSGEVGINTTAPTAGYKLHIKGSSGAHAKMKVESTTATGQAELYLTANSAGGSLIHLGDESSASIGRIAYYHTDNAMRFETNSTERMRINSSGQLIMGGSGGVALYYNRIYLAGNTSYTFDITVPDEGGAGNTFLVECGYSHYYGASYNTHLHGWYAARGTSIAAMGVLLNQNNAYAGAWSVSKPTATTLRLTKSAGTGGGTGRGFIKVTWAK